MFQNILRVMNSDLFQFYLTALVCIKRKKVLACLWALSTPPDTSLCWFLALVSRQLASLGIPRGVWVSVLWAKREACEGRACFLWCCVYFRNSDNFLDFWEVSLGLKVLFPGFLSRRGSFPGSWDGREDYFFSHGLLGILFISYVLSHFLFLWEFLIQQKHSSPAATYAW